MVLTHPHPLNEGSSSWPNQALHEVSELLLQPLQGWPGEATCFCQVGEQILAANTEKREFHLKMSAFWSSSADIKCALTLLDQLIFSTSFCSGTSMSPQRHERVLGLLSKSVSHIDKLFDPF